MESGKNQFWNSGVIVREAPIETEVVVIGAGVAGLECASKLYMHGFEDIVVLEAQEEIGGRTKTIFIDDDECKPLELGANWIHGLWVMSYLVYCVHLALIVSGHIDNEKS